MLLLAGCGEASQPPVDTEAAVEAGVEQALTASAEGYSQLGVDYSEQGDYQKSIEQFDEAIRLDPQDFKSYVARGWVNDELDQYERAIRDYDEAIRLEPRFGGTYRQRGIAYQAIGAGPAAQGDFAKAKELGVE